MSDGITDARRERDIITSANTPNGVYVVVDIEPKNVLASISEGINNYYEKYASMPTQITMSTRMQLKLKKMFQPLYFFAGIEPKSAHTNIAQTIMGLRIEVDDDRILQTGCDFIIEGK